MSIRSVLLAQVIPKTFRNHVVWRWAGHIVSLGRCKSAPYPLSAVTLLKNQKSKIQAMAGQGYITGWLSTVTALYLKAEHCYSAACSRAQSNE